VPSRRRLLGAVSASLACVAGCATSDTDTTPGGETITDPTVVRLRNPGGERALVTPRDQTGDGQLIQTRAAADGLSVPPGVSTSDERALDSLLADTAFDRETLFVIEEYPMSCRDYHVQSLYWSPGWIELEYCRRLRPPDVSCVADQRDTVAIVVRVPGEVSRDPIVRTGGNSECPDREYAVIDETPTDGTNATSATATQNATSATAETDTSGGDA